MRRFIAFTTVIGLIAGGVGCRHIGGKCDCQANPADAVPTPPTNPYAYSPAPGTPAKTPPAVMPSVPTTPANPMLPPRQ